MGSRLGPAALRLAGLANAFDELHVDFAWGGDILGYTDELGQGSYMEDIDALLRCIGELRKRTEASLKIGYTPLIIGGDHAIVMGSIAAGLSHYGEKMALLWIDAHADVNTPATSTSGN